MSENWKKRKDFPIQYFKNCVKIEFNPTVGRNVSTGRSEVIEAISKISKVEDIIRITQWFGSSLTWFIAYKEIFDVAKIIGEKIKVQGEEVVVQAPNEEFEFRTFKVMYVPALYQVDDVAHYLRLFEGKIVAKREIMVEKGSNIGTGIYNITIKYPLLSYSKLDVYKTVVGRRDVNGVEVLISMYGAQEKCLYCEEPGHKKQDCPKWKLVCKDCSKRGHAECTMASKLFSRQGGIYEETEEDIQKEDQSRGINNGESLNPSTNKSGRTWDEEASSDDMIGGGGGDGELSKIIKEIIKEKTETTGIDGRRVEATITVRNEEYPTIKEGISIVEVEEQKKKAEMMANNRRPRSNESSPGLLNTTQKKQNINTSSDSNVSITSTIGDEVEGGDFYIMTKWAHIYLKRKKTKLIFI